VVNIQEETYRCGMKALSAKSMKPSQLIRHLDAKASQSRHPKLENYSDAMKRVWNVRDLSCRKFLPIQASHEVALEIAKKITSHDWKNACETPVC